jgi:hypothetical protein
MSCRRASNRPMLALAAMIDTGGIDDLKQHLR